MRTCSDVGVDDCKTVSAQYVLQNTCSVRNLDFQVNNVHYCYCLRPLCNGENAESIIEKLGDVTDDEDDDDLADNGMTSELTWNNLLKENIFTPIVLENIDSDEASGSNEETNYSNASRGADADDQSSHEHETTMENRVYASTVPSTPAFTINKAVNFNLSRNLVNLLSCVYLIISITHRNWNN